MNLIIDYYSEAEKEAPFYNQIGDYLNQTDIHVSVNTPCQFRDELFRRNLDGVANIIILSHGYDKDDVIAHSDSWNNAIYYIELICWLNSTLKGQNIKLDLSATCNSSRALDHLAGLDKKFSEIITVNTVTPSYHAPFEILEKGYHYWVNTRYEKNKIINPYERIIRDINV